MVSLIAFWNLKHLIIKLCFTFSMREFFYVDTLYNKARAFLQANYIITKRENNIDAKGQQM